MSNQVGEIPRKSIYEHAMPISKDFLKITDSGLIEINNIEDVEKFLQSAQIFRGRGINFENVGEEKNTVEFRLANGTVDPKTWIENINLFGGIVNAAEKLGKIQNKAEEQRTQEEIKLLEKMKLLKTKDIKKDEKMEVLLDLTISEARRNIYRERYMTNKKI